MKTLRSTTQDTWYDIVDRGRIVGRAVTNDGGTHYVTAGRAVGVFASRPGMMERLQAVYGVGVKLLPAKRGRVALARAASLMRPKPAAPRLQGRSGNAAAPKPATPAASKSNKSTDPAAWGAVRWVFGTKPQEPKSEDHPLLEILKYRVAPDVDFAALVQNGKRFGVADTLAIGADARQGGRVKPVARPRPGTRGSGGRGTGRRLPRK